MTASTRPGVARLVGTGELIAALPFQLGYRPERSVVLGLLEAAGEGRWRAGPMMRIDLPDDRDAAGLAVQVVALARRHAPEAVHLVGYEQDPGASLPLLHAMREACEAVSLPVERAARVHEGRWVGIDPSADQEQVWRALPAPAEVPAIADLVLHGAAPVARREDLEARFEPADLALREAVRTELGVPRPPTPAQVRQAMQTLNTVVAGRVRAEQLEPARLAEVARALEVVPVRDAVLAHLVPALWAQEEDELLSQQVHTCLRLGVMTDTTVSRLAGVAAHLPGGWAVQLLACVGLLAWSLGDGSCANIAVDRALAQQPEHRLSSMLARALSVGVPPPGGR